MAKRLLFIMNPFAGKGTANTKLAEILSLFANEGYKCTVQMTTLEEQGTEIVEKYGKGKDLIVAVGGDGTLNQVMNGAMKMGLDTPIGYIPTGTANDFAHSLKFSVHPVKQAQKILTGISHPLDICTFKERTFTYVASFGAFTKTSYSTPQSMKNALGHFAYILEGIKDISSIHREHLKIELDDTVLEGDYAFGAFSNSTSMGGVVKLDENLVDMNDGKFEVMLIKMPKNIIELNKMITMLNTKKYDDDLIEFHSSSYAKITCNPDMDWTLDGECEHGREEIEIKNIHGAINIMIPCDNKLKILK